MMRAQQQDVFAWRRRRSLRQALAAVHLVAVHLVSLGHTVLRDYPIFQLIVMIEKHLEAHQDKQ